MQGLYVILLKSVKQLKKKKTALQLLPNKYALERDTKGLRDTAGHRL